MARLPFVDQATAAPEVAEIFQKMTERGVKIQNVYRVMGNSQAAFIPFMRFGNALLQRTSLDPKIRELVVLRVATLTGSKYEWQQHESIALEFGVTPAQVATIGDWERSAAFDARERAILRYIDGVTRDVEVDDETFAGVRALFDDTELVELTLTIGFYGMLARFLGPLQVDLEDEVAASAAQMLGKRRR
jgi:4-carboxymuconolactone decarboxylase